MNKIINLLSLFTLVVYSFFTIGSLYDLGYSVYSVNDIPYISEITTGFAIITLLLGIIRIKRRRDGKKDINKFTRFSFSTAISKKQRTNSYLFIGIETFFMISFTVLLLIIKPMDDNNYVLPMLIVLIIIGLESLLYLIEFIIKPSKFRIGVSDKLIAYFDREMHLYYYNGLQRVEIYQEMINFKYKKGLNLFLRLEVIPKEDHLEFLSNLKNLLDKKTVFFDDSFDQYVNSIKP